MISSFGIDASIEASVLTCPEVARPRTRSATPRITSALSGPEASCSVNLSASASRSFGEKRFIIRMSMFFSEAIRAPPPFRSSRAPALPQRAALLGDRHRDRHHHEDDAHPEDPPWRALVHQQAVEHRRDRAAEVEPGRDDAEGAALRAG